MKLLNNIIRKSEFFFHSMVDDDADASLLSRDESNAVKGLLILLVILGHNKYLMQGGYSYRFLYSFHVYSFFLLPFLYNWKDSLLKDTLWRNLKRFYVPYTITFIALYVISVMQSNDLSISKLLLAWVCGSQHLLSEAFGSGSFLWFIPTMFSLLAIRWFYYKGSKRMRSLLLCCSLISLIGFAYVLYPFTLLWLYSPFCIYLALAMLLPAVVCRRLFRSMNPQIVGLAFFMLMVAVMVVYPLKGYFYTYLTINRLICPTLILLFILSLRGCLRDSALLKNIGKYSFQLYLIHLFVYNGSYYIIDKYLETNICIGFILYIAVLFVSYSLARIPFLKVMFPR